MAIVPVLRWPLPAAAAVLGCALGVQAAEPAQARRRHQKPPVEGQLNVNKASEAELQLLPGIGKGRARAIVERRQQARFRSLDDVARIKGMGRLVQRLRAHLTVDGPSTLRPAAAAPERQRGRRRGAAQEPPGAAQAKAASPPEPGSAEAPPVPPGE